MGHPGRQPETGNCYRTVSRYAFFAFAAVAAYFVIAEHRAHIVPWLPYLLLAACPLMHLFHHRGHEHRDEDSRRGSG